MESKFINVKNPACTKTIKVISMNSDSIGSQITGRGSHIAEGMYTHGYLEMGMEFGLLKTLNGMEGILLISRSGEVFWSWQNPNVELNIRTMRLVGMIKTIIPIMLDMPDIGVQRSLFQFDYAKEFISMYFTNIGDHAFICCILGRKFDYINVTEEVSKAAFIMGKKLSRMDIEPEEMKQYLKEVSARTSQSISLTMNQFSKITKKRSKNNGVK